MNYINRLYCGRISRLNFFLGTLFFQFISIILTGVLLFIPAILIGLIHPIKTDPAVSTGIFFIVYFLISALCISTIIIRRFHDFGLTGYYSLICLIYPIIPFVFLFLYFKKGTDVQNKYGSPVISERLMEAVFKLRK